MLSLFVNWDVSRELFDFGGISISYYWFLFANAFNCLSISERVATAFSNNEAFGNRDIINSTSL